MPHDRHLARSFVLGILLVSLFPVSAGARSICFLPPDVGPCDGVCPRYFYNPDTNACEEFIWGCCDGNENNFETQAECEAACANAVPAASTWLLVVLALTLVAAGTVLTRRTRHQYA